MFVLLTWLIFLSFLLESTWCILEAYTGNEPLDSTSPIFSIKLTQSTTILYPKVYYGQANTSRYICSNAGLPPAWYYRSISWIEFGQESSDIVLINISIKTGETLFNTTQFPVRILPLSYNIIPIISNDYTSLSFKVYGNYKTISVEYGEYLVGNNQSNFMNSLLIFIGDLSNQNINKSASNVIYFSPGVHNITNEAADGILRINKTINTIYIERGAFVYGKIDDTLNFNGRLNIIGYGILCGTYFDYCYRWNDSIAGFSMIESNRAVTIHGLTVYDPSWFMMQNELPPNSIIKSFKGMAWYFNNDGLGISSNGIIQDSFCRTADDSYKIESGNNMTLKNNVIWQTYNGDCHQMGWFGSGITNCTIKDIDVIHGEWTNGYYGNGIIGLAGDNNTNINTIYNNILFENIRIDNPLGRIIGLWIVNVSVGIKHIFDGMIIRNVTSRTKLQWTVDQYHNQTTDGNQILIIENCDGECEINNIHFENIFIDGNKILNNQNNNWNLIESGQIISNISYS